MAAISTSPKGTSRKQLYVVIGLGVALLAIVALQAPRFLGGGGGAETTPSSTTDALPTSSAANPTGGTPSAVSFDNGAVLAGVTIVPGLAPRPAEGQLASFSLFVRRDPFVQLVKDADGSGASQDGEPAGVKVSNGGGRGSTAGSSNGGSSASTAGSSQLTTATIWVNGSEESVDVKKKFPQADPTFVLASLKPKVAQIAVAGGAFTGGATIPLKMGQTLTLVNTATGARYTLRLLYTGSAPEQVQQFTQAQN
jgi:hypothetical protein